MNLQSLAEEVEAAIDGDSFEALPFIENAENLPQHAEVMAVTDGLLSRALGRLAITDDADSNEEALRNTTFDLVLKGYYVGLLAAQIAGKSPLSDGLNVEVDHEALGAMFSEAMRTGRITINLIAE